ncbi:hypothetical protein HPB47_008759 [Ixodes persulcatus]|uniref:Uncharacterized protein n=1 Tax=Ixodes persulcatus TaxID=34615 RepID=A0AC60P3V6_IXOPE|nr:hypothetical protein HPB47_008759 [Ixodes persulcatus]
MGGCSAVGCSNNAKKGFWMYRFPQGKENRARHKIWETKPKRADWKPTSSTSWRKRRPLSPLDLAGRKPLPPAELSQNVDFLVRESHTWFCHSSKRKAAYSQLHKSLCDGEDPLVIPRVCDTRWISLEPAVVRKFSDPLNKLYLLYLRPPTRPTRETTRIREASWKCHAPDKDDPKPYLGCEFEKLANTLPAGPEVDWYATAALHSHTAIN